MKAQDHLDWKVWVPDDKSDVGKPLDSRERRERWYRRRSDR